jgi:hypothetical protein
MRQTNLNSIEANSSHDLIAKITRERVKKIVKPDISKMIRVIVPSLRLTYYCQNQERVNRRVKELNKTHPDIEVIIKKPVK